MTKQKTLLVTLADNSYVSQAKQLFASAYFTGGWTGDLMLLSHNISKTHLQWFRDRSIFIKYCTPLKEVGSFRPASSSKLYIFGLDMKQWQTVVYLDADIIVRASLDKLPKVQTYAVTPELDRQPLRDQFIFKTNRDKKEYSKIVKTIGMPIQLHELSFNTGVIAFQTSIINKNTFNDLVTLLARIKSISAFGEQTAQNIYFYNNWEHLPVVYNICPHLYNKKYLVPNKHIQGINLHFASYTPDLKPWNKSSPYYAEWKKNFDSSGFINYDTPPITKTTWSEAKIRFYEIWYALIRNRYILSIRSQAKKTKKSALK